MSKRMDKYRVQYKEKLAGDDASLYSGLISELAKTGGGIASEVQKSQAEKTKAADLAAAKKARAEADAAALAAQSEKDPNGPLHAAARAKDAGAKALEKAMADKYPDTTLSKPESKPEQKSASSSKYVWYALGGLGVLAAGLLTYKLLRRK